MHIARLLVASVVAVVSLVPRSADAGVRAPQGRGCGLPPPPVCWARSSAVLSDPQDGCQYVFLPSPATDRLTLSVILRDAFDNPVAGWPVEAEALPHGDSALCGCDGLTVGGVSGPAGDVQLVFGLLGGRGTLEIDVTVFHPDSGTPYPVAWLDGRPFTSSDQGASCEPVGPVANVVDLGLWAHGLPPSPYLETSDLNCDGTVNIIDLGRFAAGLYEGCAED